MTKGFLMRGLVLLGLLMGVALAASSPATAVNGGPTLVVGPGGGTGQCASPAFGTIQSAIDAAVDDNTIYICPGTYPGGNDLGGFEGDSLAFEGAGDALTIIDGDLGGGQLFTDSSPGTLEEVSFSQMTMQNGEATAQGAIPGDGGAIDLADDPNVGANVTLSGVTVRDNVASDEGGAVHAMDVDVANSAFLGNRAGVGQGLANVRGGAVHAKRTATLIESRFEENFSRDQGGAVFAETSVIAADTLFELNRTEWDGGAVFSVGSLATANATFANNTANDSGGAAYVQSGATCLDYFAEAPCSSFTEFEDRATGSSFLGNSAEGNAATGDGGAIRANSILFAYRSVFRLNKADDIDPFGPPDPDGGAIYAEGSGPDKVGLFRIYESTFKENSAADDGGAIYLDLNNPQGDLPEVLGLFSSTLTGNSAESGGAVFSANNGSVGLISSTLTGNQATDGAAAMLAGGELIVRASTSSGNTASSGASLTTTTPIYSIFAQNSIIDEPAGGCQTAAPIQNDFGNVVTQGSTGCEGAVGGPPAPTSTVSREALALLPLADNGGPTETMALGPTSVAIGAGVKVNCPDQDQRGYWTNGTCNAGAYGYRYTPNPPPPVFVGLALTPKSAKVKAGRKVTLTVKLRNQGILTGTATVRLKSSNRGKATVPSSVKLTVGPGRTASKKVTVTTRKKQTGKVRITASLGGKSSAATLTLRK